MPDSYVNREHLHPELQEIVNRIVPARRKRLLSALKVAGLGALAVVGLAATARSKSFAVGAPSAILSAGATGLAARESAVFKSANRRVRTNTIAFGSRLLRGNIFHEKHKGKYPDFEQLRDNYKWAALDSNGNLFFTNRKRLFGKVGWMRVPTRS